MSNSRPIFSSITVKDGYSTAIFKSSTGIIYGIFQIPSTITEPDATLYEVLNLPYDATPTDIKKAYQKFALLYHPESVKASRDKLREISHAYYVLSDTKRKQAYDETLFSVSKEAIYRKQSFEYYCYISDKKITDQLMTFEKKSQVEMNRPSGVIYCRQSIPQYSAMTQPFRKIKKNAILFTVGLPVKINDGPNSFRKNILAGELLNSFLNQDNNFPVFLTQADALIYSRAKRQGNFYQDATCLQMPLIEISLTHDVNENTEVKRLEAFINERHNSEKIFSEHTLEYIVLSKYEFEALNLTLHIETVTINKIYPAVNLTNCCLIEEDRKLLGCSIQ